MVILFLWFCHDLQIPEWVDSVDEETENRLNDLIRKIRKHHILNSLRTKPMDGEKLGEKFVRLVKKSITNPARDLDWHTDAQLLLTMWKRFDNNHEGAVDDMEDMLADHDNANLINEILVCTYSRYICYSYNVMLIMVPYRSVMCIVSMIQRLLLDWLRRICLRGSSLKGDPVGILPISIPRML